MLLINNKKKLAQKIFELKKIGRKINFIPTMGNLHHGHISLIKAAKKKNFVRLVSIYVNPHQFDDNCFYQKDISYLHNSFWMIFIPE